jgi:two-component system response regulator DevR
VLKQVRGDDLIAIIRSVGQGHSLLDPTVTKGVLERLRKGKQLLQGREAGAPVAAGGADPVAGGEGRTNRQIGQQLRLAEKTVKNYVSGVLARLEVARRAEAAAYLAHHTTTQAPERRSLPGHLPDPAAKVALGHDAH